ncbi:MAG TPA: PKD domain-containing protein [Edaphocola sp.]|nr:PKD domain-containing protein [Edaphocola sp.]
MAKRSLQHVLCFGLIFFLNYSTSFASHMIGGDITYKCLGNDTFQITLTLFQDALTGQNTAILLDNPAYYAIYTQGNNPVLVRQGSVAARSTDTIPPGFSNDCISNFPATRLRRQIFVFNVRLDPSNVGYYIVYQRCCRNATISNIVNPGNVGVTYLAEIPPFTAGECPNNSAVFNSLPPQIICVNNPFSYDFSATDPDGDSLSYELCEAHPGGGPDNARPTGTQISPPPYSSIQYLPPYTAAQPIPGTPPITIDPVTGMMSGTPSQTGRFIVTVCCHEWRNGTIINTLSRDVQFVITDCSKNVIADIPVLSDFPNTYIVECDGYTVHFINNSTGGNTYHWDFGVPGAISNQFEPSYTYPDTGTYKVKLVVNPGTTCTDSITRLVKVYPVFKAGFTYDGKLCAGEPIRFTDTSFATFPPIISRQWNFGDGSAPSTVQNPTHVYAAPGGAKTVTLAAQTAIGCRDTAKVVVPLGYLDVFAGNDTIIVKGYPFNLNGRGAQYYSWTPSTYLSDPNIADPSVSFPDTGKYEYVLTGSTEQGCVAKDSLTIWVVSGGIVFVPTGFTPNGDGKNDFIKPIIVGYSEIDNFRIFNRYGQTVYMSSVNNAPSWDGTLNGRPCDMGTYYWVMTVTNVNGKKETKKGDITLIR